MRSPPHPRARYERERERSPPRREGAREWDRDWDCFALALLVITTAEDMIQGRDTGNADADTWVIYLRVRLFFSLICFVTITEAPRYHSQLILPLHYLWTLEFATHQCFSAQRSAIASHQS